MPSVLSDNVIKFLIPFALFFTARFLYKSPEVISVYSSEIPL